eukprot:COSAG01_NODE_468_length_16589_cov_4.457429_2_plen_83_part_00
MAGAAVGWWPRRQPAPLAPTQRWRWVNDTRSARGGVVHGGGSQLRSEANLSLCLTAAQPGAHDDATLAALAEEPVTLAVCDR